MPSSCLIVVNVFLHVKFYGSNVARRITAIEFGPWSVIDARQAQAHVPEVLNVHVNENNLKNYFFQKFFFLSSD